MKNEEKSYKPTLQLPQTTFPMRGNLVEQEPRRLAKWEEEGTWKKVLEARRAEGAEEFLLHDGPPFANGDVHMGTALNKVLKDFVVRSRTMAGYAAPFVPGWDCHGLPIEYKVMQDARGEQPAEIRRRCEEFARGWINTQRESFRRLGVWADWEHPYLTLDPAYEADILRVFATLVERGAVYQSLKPVQWSYGARTALAEAEVEYQEKESTAVFVAFPLVEGEGALAIWTTTPWTLPANRAVAMHPRFDYLEGVFEKEGKQRVLVVARDLVSRLAEQTGWELREERRSEKGEAWEGVEYDHPFLPQRGAVLMADFVTAEDGTGLVHIAPGHGADDYQLGLSAGLEVFSPVDDDGKFTAEVGVEELVGVHVFKGNGRVVEILEEKGALLAANCYRHSYPHCWRSKTPIIFRAVEQFFISLDEGGLRARALEEIQKVQWLPSWGQSRMAGTVEARPDWCISRQRTWGVPLPVFFDAEGEVILRAELVREVAQEVAEHGSQVWFTRSDEEWAQRLGLPAGSRRGRDTLDVWIDSGSSSVAVLAAHPELRRPADLYLEATDQHRGWFQSSLLLGVACADEAPYRAVMTHGFVVDQDTGKKTSKSDEKKSGKPTDAAHFYNKYGADILRLWVSSVDWQNEVPFGEDLFKQVGEPYRRLRNTLRMLLANRQAGASRPAELSFLDRWILESLVELSQRVQEAYERYDFRRVFSLIGQFCAQDLSAHYVDITKDRLYCDGLDSPRRISTAWTYDQIFEHLVRLLAPILAFTAEEAWEHAGHEGSVHGEKFLAAPTVDWKPVTPTVRALFEVRSLIQAKVEKAVQGGDFKKNNEAAVQLQVPAASPLRPLLEDEDFAKEFFIIAELVVVEGDALAAQVVKTTHAMCPRCRRYEPATSPEGLCGRCEAVVSTLEAKS